jgi:hypothetical protein
MNIAGAVEAVLETGFTNVFVSLDTEINATTFEEVVRAFEARGATVFATREQWSKLASLSADFDCDAFVVCNSPAPDSYEEATAEEQVVSASFYSSIVASLRAAHAPAAPHPLGDTIWQHMIYRSRDSIEEAAQEIGLLPDDKFVLWSQKSYGSCAIVFRRMLSVPNANAA